MSEYIPSPRSWVSEHVEQYEGSGGTEGAVYIAPEFPDGLRMILVTHRGRKTGAIRKTPLIRAWPTTPKDSAPRPTLYR